jgi:hypothetical protein
MPVTLAARGNWVAQFRQFVEPRVLERCDFCASVIPARHAHLLERDTRQLQCACIGCALSLGESERFRLVSPRAESLPGFVLDEGDWSALQIPIGMAFLYRRMPEDRPVAVYPSPAGATEAQLDAAAWSRLVAANPTIAELQTDVEALLVNRVNGAREYYRVSIDRCFSLVGLIRRHWRGLSGGTEAWEAIEAFFGAMRSDKAAHG